MAVIRRFAVSLLLAAGICLPQGCGHIPRRLESGILSGMNTWQGKVEVRGVLLVDRDAYLRIEPGTEVVFLHVDEDGDGIGDGELNVLGTLSAVGTPSQPIVFRSDRGRKKDWTFLHLSGNRESRLAHCVFRDAFTGIQLHYVNAHVSNCLFFNNHEGLRYSTVRGEIRHNTFQGNTVGVRFEGRQSRVLVEKNLFFDNDIAVFPVTLGSRDDRFRSNVFSSREYNVRLGIEQKGDLDFSHNFWGVSSRDRISETIFDGRDDPSLGTVEFEPFLADPVPGAGPESPLMYEASP